MAFGQNDGTKIRNFNAWGRVPRTPIPAPPFQPAHPPNRPPPVPPRSSHADRPFNSIYPSAADGGLAPGRGELARNLSTGLFTAKPLVRNTSDRSWTIPSRSSSPAPQPWDWFGRVLPVHGSSCQATVPGSFSLEPCSPAELGWRGWPAPSRGRLDHREVETERLETVPQLAPPGVTAPMRRGQL